MDVVSLAIVSSRTQSQVHRDLWQASHEGLLLRSEDTYTFLHDRVRQAAWMLTPEEQRAEVHLQSGRRLLASTPEAEREARIFTIAQLLNEGASLLAESSEREELAELNLLAGRKAKATTAWASAVSYLAAGMAVMDPQVRLARRDLDFDLRHERAWCEYLNGQRPEAEQLLQGLMAEPWLDLAQRAELSYLQVELDMTCGEIPRAITHGLECLKQFGHHVSEHPSDEEVTRAHEELSREQRDRSLEELLELPLMKRADMKALMRVLAACLVPAIFLDRRLARLLATTMSILGLRHGHSDTSAWGYACLGLSLVASDVARYQEGYRFGLLAHELTKKHVSTWASRVTAFFAGIRTWVRAERTNLELTLESIRQGMEEGDLSWVTYCFNGLIASQLYVGTPLEEVLQECERRTELMRRVGDPNASLILESQRRFVRCMQGHTASLSTFDGEHFREQDFEASLPGKAALAVQSYYLLKMQALLLAGEVERVLEIARKVQPLPPYPDSTFSTRPESLDLMTVLKASQTISSGLHLPQLLETLLRTVLEHVGAQRGCLLVEQSGLLEVEAEAHAEGGQVRVFQGQGAPVEQRLPASIARYVHRTRESVVLADASTGGGFSADLYIQRVHPRSVLCMPLVYQGRSQGLLYLENNLAQGAFTQVRLAGLQLLASQVSISLENARLYRAAREAVRVRDEFLSVASHELKTPLTSLSLQTQRLARLLQRGTDEALRPELVSGVLEAFNRQTQRLARLVDQLLDVSLLHSGRLELRLEHMDLGALVREVVERTGGLLALAGCPVELQVPEHAVGRWDRARLEQVLLNLLTNAMKYGAGKPVRIRVEQLDGHVRLEVQDEGIGISPEDQVRIFERFERTTPTRHHFEGLGLGLYITRQVVLAHGGSIQVKSALGQGATFTVELPREPKARGAIPPAAGR